MTAAEVKTWQDVALVALNVGQVVALAYLASRSRLRRRDDRRQPAAKRRGVSKQP